MPYPEQWSIRVLRAYHHLMTGLLVEQLQGGVQVRLLLMLDGVVLVWNDLLLHVFREP